MGKRLLRTKAGFPPEQTDTRAGSRRGLVAPLVSAFSSKHRQHHKRPLTTRRGQYCAHGRQVATARREEARTQSAGPIGPCGGDTRRSPLAGSLMDLHNDIRPILK
ncbi:hypothetical protein BaRGS_00015432 [Batillaria attramentaria]|uniref:Uncharacterized protein n=1 Tax=Batillaria attramentaria TaxID=370345 RepID=A0ABD0L1U6_9CAEN